MSLSNLTREELEFELRQLRQHVGATLKHGIDALDAEAMLRLFDIQPGVLNSESACVKIRVDDKAVVVTSTEARIFALDILAAAEGVEADLIHYMTLLPEVGHDDALRFVQKTRAARILHGKPGQGPVNENG